MGKFLKYEDANARTFVIDQLNKTVKRPKRKIAKEDLLGAIVNIDGGVDSMSQAIVLSVSDLGIGYAFPVVVGNGILSGSYIATTDTFKFGDDVYTNIFVDEFGREEKYI